MAALEPPTIGPDAMVRISLQIVAFSHTSQADAVFFDYHGVESLLDITIGRKMVLPAVEAAVLSMAAHEERDVVVRAVDAPTTAKALGVNIRGALKYRLKLLRVVAIPNERHEVTRFFARRSVNLQQLRRVDTTRRGSFTVARTYDMVHADTISEEYRILESMLKTHLPAAPPSSSSSSSHSGVARLVCDLLPADDNTNTNTTNRTDGSKRVGGIRLVAPTLPLSQRQELFLPDVLRTAVQANCRMIVLFDAPGDWDTLAQTYADTDTDDGGIDPALAAGSVAVAAAGVGGHALVEADLTMGVESEEADGTASTVLTWVRVAVEAAEAGNGGTAAGAAPVSLVNSSGQEQVPSPAALAAAYAAPAAPTITFSDGAGTVNGGGPDDPKVTVINMMAAGGGSERDVFGYRCALLRCSTWQAGMAPQKRHWDGFWALYQR